MANQDAKWEYYTLLVGIINGQIKQREVVKQLNELGEDGWELISVTPILHQGQTNYLVHHFRRMPEAEQRMGFTR